MSLFVKEKTYSAALFKQKKKEIKPLDFLLSALFSKNDMGRKKNQQKNTGFFAIFVKISLKNKNKITLHFICNML